MSLKTAVNPALLRQLFGQFATGVTVVTTIDAEGEVVAITANSFSSVSLEPPLLLWCLDARSRHIAAFSTGRSFAIHILNRDQTEIALQCARSGRPPVARRGGTAPPYVAECLARIECRVADVHSAGDHVIIVGEIENAEMAAGAPLLFHGSRFGGFAPARDPNGDEAWDILVDMWS